VHGFLRQFADGVFEPEAVKILTDAFDDAWADVQASKAPWATEEYALAARTIIANHIVAAAKAGNLNRASLVDSALIHLTRQKLHRKPPDTPSDQA
jgi:hypothetical protein